MRSIRCRLGRHAGQADGGTLMFTCPRCGGSFWQPVDYTATTLIANRLIAQGRNAEALELIRETLRRRES